MRGVGALFAPHDRTGCTQRSVRAGGKVSVPVTPLEQGGGDPTLRQAAGVLGVYYTTGIPIRPQRSARRDSDRKRVARAALESRLCCATGFAGTSEAWYEIESPPLRTSVGGSSCSR